MEIHASGDSRHPATERVTHCFGGNEDKLPGYGGRNHPCWGMPHHRRPAKTVPIDRKRWHDTNNSTRRWLLNTDMFGAKTTTERGVMSAEPGSARRQFTPNGDPIMAAKFNLPPRRPWTVVRQRLLDRV